MWSQVDSRKIEGKVAVIAGGATGLGEATSRTLSALGASVVVADINFEAASALTEPLTAAGFDATPASFDISDEESVANLFRQVVELHGGLDILVNVAADLSPAVLGRDSDLVDVPLEVWRRTIEVDLTGYFLTARAAVPLMVSRGGGRIVNISSEASVLGEDTRPGYGAAKAGVNALTRHIARRWGKVGIRCNAVAPGLVPTASAVNNPGSPSFDDRASTNPTGRLGVVEDIAAPVGFLVSPEADWINGQVLHVSGGQVMGM
jgi:NAD(P)-dependent dehydrogenase (short-subunit alcohol dehydrogenase family)